MNVQRLLITATKRMYLAAILFFFIPGERVRVAALLTLKAKWFASLTKTMEIMMNKVVLIFSPSDEKTPYQQGENGTVVPFSR